MVVSKGSDLSLVGKIISHSHMHQTKHLLAINTGCSHIKLNVIPTQKDTNQSCCFSKIGKNPPSDTVSVSNDVLCIPKMPLDSCFQSSSYDMNIAKGDVIDLSCFILKAQHVLELHCILVYWGYCCYLVFIPFLWRILPHVVVVYIRTDIHRSRKNTPKKKITSSEIYSWFFLKIALLRFFK